MRKTVLIALFLVGLVFHSSSQNTLPDSVSNIVNSPHENIHTRFKALINYASRESVTNPDVAIYFLDSANRFAAGSANDSLISASMEARANYYLKRAVPDSAIYYYKKALSIPDISPKLKTYTELGFAEALYRGGRFDSALVLIENSIDYGEQTNDTIVLLKAYSNGGMIFSRMGDYASAINYLKKSIELNKSEDKKLRVISHIRLGVVYFALNDYARAMLHYRKALSFKIPVSDRGVHSSIYNNIARIHEEEASYDSAIYYYSKSVAAIKRSNADFRLPVAYLNMGNVFSKQENYEKSLEYYKMVYESEAAKKQPELMTAILVNLGNIYLETGNYDTAAYYLERGRKHASKYNYLNFLYNAFQVSARLDSARGYYLGSMAYRDSMLTLQDSMWNDKLNSRMAAIEAENNVEQTKRANELLQKRDLANQNKIFYQRLALFAVLGLSLAILIFFTVVYRSKQKLQKLNDMLQEKNQQIQEKNIQLQTLNKTKDKFFSIVAHDLKGPFGTLLALLEELEFDYDAFNEKERKEIIANLHMSGQRTYNLLLNLLEWSRSQRDMITNKPSEINMYDKVEEIRGVLDSRAQSKKIEIVNQLDRNEAKVKADPEMVATIFINLINNAIKFSHPDSEVRIESREKDPYIQVSVIDQGIGIPEELMQNLFEINNEAQRIGTQRERGTGLGLVLCHDFITEIGGRILVSSEPGKGSKFSVQLPKA